MVPMFLVAAALAMQPAAPPPAKTAPAKVARADQIVCRKEKPLGSNLPKEVCLKRREWTAIDRAQRDQAAQTAMDTEITQTGRDGMR